MGYIHLPAVSGGHSCISPLAARDGSLQIPLIKHTEHTTVTEFLGDFLNIGSIEDRVKHGDEG